LVEGGPVLVTANQRGADGALALANGFRGVLAGVDPGGKGLLLDSDTGSGTVLLRPRVARRRAWANAKGYADVIVWWWDVKSAFALTVHKTQGLTLHNIAVDLGPDVFDPQQPYVALSRASSLQGVTVLPGFTAACLTQSRPTRGAAWTRAFDAVLQQRSAEWARHKRARTR
jgi:ATP-dependent exoDNAse (exonuclease V) alpha subunit